MIQDVMIQDVMIQDVLAIFEKIVNKILKSTSKNKIAKQG